MVRCKDLFKRLLAVGGLALIVAACSTQDHSHAVYMLIDTSGTYATEARRAQTIVNYLLGTLQPGDALAIAQVDSRSFTEKNIIAKATFDRRPSEANNQKRAFRDAIERYVQTVRASTHTDITGGVLQAAEFLNETRAGNKTLLIFSDMQEELDKSTLRDFPIDLKGIRVVAVNVVKLRTDNVDPRRYMGRLEWWEKRVRQAGAIDWQVINDFDHLERVVALR
jgi:hypothetical protein